MMQSRARDGHIRVLPAFQSDVQIKISYTGGSLRRTVLSTVLGPAAAFTVAPRPLQPIMESNTRQLNQTERVE